MAHFTQIQNTHQVVIIGAGFGGLAAAKALAGAAFKVTLVDQHNAKVVLAKGVRD